MRFTIPAAVPGDLVSLDRDEIMGAPVSWHERLRPTPVAPGEVLLVVCTGSDGITAVLYRGKIVHPFPGEHPTFVRHTVVREH